MDVSLSTPTTLARDAASPQTSANAGAGAGPSAPPPAAAPLETVTAVLSPAQTTLVRLLSDAVRSATALQGGLAALLPDLVQAQSMVVVPTAVRAAIAGVIETAAPLQAIPSDSEITTAFLRAGTPPSQQSTTVAPMTSQPLPAAADLRAALQTLQQALQHWNPETTASSPGAAPSSPPNSPSPMAQPQAATTAAPQLAPAAGAPTQAASLPLGTTPLPQIAVAAQPAATQGMPGQVNPQAVPTLHKESAPVVLPAPQTLASVAQAAAAPVAELGDAMASLLLLQRSARSVTQGALRPRAANAKVDGTPLEKEGTLPGIAAGLPSAKGQGRSLDPVSPVTRWPTNPDAAFVARTLASRTENALTQVKLLEVASHLQRTEDRQPAATAPEPRWSFDLPFQTPQGQSKAHFEIERDTYRAAGGKDARVWRVRFSIDVEPLGPVHTQIALMGKNAWVSIMTEREASMRLLESQQQALLKGFGADDLNAEVICGIGKAPARTGTIAAGKLLDSAI